MWQKIIHPFTNGETYTERVSDEQAAIDFGVFRARPDMWLPVIETSDLHIVLWNGISGLRGQVWMYVRTP